jgi:hypothetical protein
VAASGGGPFGAGMAAAQAGRRGTGPGVGNYLFNRIAYHVGSLTGAAARVAFALGSELPLALQKIGRPSPQVQTFNPNRDRLFLRSAVGPVHPQCLPRDNFEHHPVRRQPRQQRHGLVADPRNDHPLTAHQAGITGHGDLLRRARQ